ncbi:MAG: hypothetical protein IJ930_00820 [Lachnospiraceae bacterium]|nr:hypothetical protein [Lachnospiraceae bacterium]
MKKLGKALIIAAFVILFILTYITADRLLCLKTEKGIRQAREIYAQPENTIDVAFLGTSHIHCNVNTALLYEGLGMASYDYSAAEQPLWITYYYLQELCKTQHPKLVVLDVFAPARFSEDYQYNFLLENLDGVRFSPNKVRMILASCEPGRIKDFFPSMVTYHDRYKELTDEDLAFLNMSVDERASYKGYTPFFEVGSQTRPDIQVSESGGLSAKSEEYLRKIMEYCEENGIELNFLVTPYIMNEEQVMVYNRIREIADENALLFLDANMAADEMGLNYETDFCDYSHLNYMGSCKFTAYLGNLLKSRYDIPDRRGQEGWESWDRHVKEFNAYIEEIIRQMQEAAGS